MKLSRKQQYILQVAEKQGRITIDLYILFYPRRKQFKESLRYLEAKSYLKLVNYGEFELSLKGKKYLRGKDGHCQEVSL